MTCGVLSGNRNFEGRIHPLTRANYLASPPLVIAYALAGTVCIDFEQEPLGKSLGTLWQGFQASTTCDKYSGIALFYFTRCQISSLCLCWLVGYNSSGQAVFLRDIWPSREEIQVCTCKMPSTTSTLPAKTLHCGWCKMAFGACASIKICGVLLLVGDRARSRDTGHVQGSLLTHTGASSCCLQTK